MPALKRVTRNQRLKLRNGKVVKLGGRSEAAPAVYFGVRFKDGHTVFMMRARNLADRDHAELRAHALKVRGMDPEKDADQIAGVAEACVQCARSVKGCPGCGHSAAMQKDAEDHADGK